MSQKTDYNQINKICFQRNHSQLQNYKFASYFVTQTSFHNYVTSKYPYFSQNCNTLWYTTSFNAYLMCYLLGNRSYYRKLKPS